MGDIHVGYDMTGDLTNRTTNLVSALQTLIEDLRSNKNAILSIFIGQGAEGYDQKSTEFEGRLDSFKASLEGLNRKVIQVATRGGDFDTMDKTVANWFHGI